jgi:AcrR family transcriptional regulator
MGDDVITTDAAEVKSTRRRILEIALQLMSQRGVDGTSMRDLASAAGLNVASLYHYFPSKRELLEAVLVEHGFLPARASAPHMDLDSSGEAKLATILIDVLNSMFEVEDFVRLMVGEAIRGEETARAVGIDLFNSFQTSMSDWIVKHRPDLDERSGATPVATLLTAMVVGIFVQHAAGVIGEGQDLEALTLKWAGEAAQILSN